MFIVVFVIMLPIYLTTKDPMRAWEAGLAWAFIIGVIVLIGAFVGPYIRKYHAPGRDARHPGRHLDHLHLDAAGRADVGGGLDRRCRCSRIILIGFFTNMRLPGGIPIGLAALLVGTAIGWIGGVHVGAGRAAAAAKDIAIAVPDLARSTCCSPAWRDMAPLLATAIPLGVYNFTEAMSNVESAAAAGDSYNLRSVLLADGAGAIIGAALGSPFPPAVYIGHPGWKAAGGRSRLLDGERRGHRGAVLPRACSACSARCFPMPAIVPILLYIGLLIGAQAFQATPEIARRGGGRRDHPEHRVLGHRPDRQRARRRPAPPPRRSGDEALNGAGVVYDGLQIARSGRGPGRPGARRDRGVHHRQAVHPRPAIFAGCRRGAGLRRADPRARRSSGTPTARSRSATCSSRWSACCSRWAGPRRASPNRRRSSWTAGTKRHRDTPNGPAAAGGPAATADPADGIRADAGGQRLRVDRTRSGGGGSRPIPTGSTGSRSDGGKGRIAWRSTGRRGRRGGGGLRRLRAGAGRQRRRPDLRLLLGVRPDGAVRPRRPAVRAGTSSASGGPRSRRCRPVGGWSTRWSPRSARTSRW